MPGLKHSTSASERSGTTAYGAKRTGWSAGVLDTGHRQIYEKSGMRFRCAASSSIVSSEGRDS